VSYPREVPLPADGAQFHDCWLRPAGFTPVRR
jgi:hypothetical protein